MQAVTCPRCGRIMEFIDRYCSNCAKSLRAVKGLDKQAEKKLPPLSIANNADVTSLVETILLPGNASALPYPSVEAIIELLASCCSEQQQQIIIRRHGLDGQSSRTFTAIAKEAGASSTVIHKKYHKAIHKLRRSL